MARYSYQESDNYNGSNGIYFNLKDDKDSAKIRFLINDINDLYGVSCHKVKVGDKEIDVECLRAYNEPVSKCPLCEAEYKVNARLFIPVYNEDAKEAQIWAKGNRFFNKISSLCARYNPLVSTVFEVERQGKKGDTHTDYQFFVVKTDEKQLQDFKMPEAENTVFKVKTYDEMKQYLESGSFPDNKQQTHQSQVSERQVPVRRRPAVEEDNY